MLGKDKCLNCHVPPQWENMASFSCAKYSESEQTVIYIASWKRECLCYAWFKEVTLNVLEGPPPPHIGLEFMLLARPSAHQPLKYNLKVLGINSIDLYRCLMHASRFVILGNPCPNMRSFFIHIHSSVISNWRPVLLTFTENQSKNLQLLGTNQN